MNGKMRRFQFLFVLTIFTLFLILLFGSEVLAQTCVQPPEDIIAWWPLDETSGTIAEDITGNNLGAHVNSPVHSDGKVAGSLRFNGSNYVGVSDSDLWAFGSNDFTIELWANWDRSGGGSIGHPGDIFIGNDEGPGTRNKWFFALGGGVLNFHINGPSTGSRFFPRAPFSPIVGRWYHLAVTRSGNTFTIYVDGEPKASTTETRAIPNANAPLTIGQAEQLGFMNGRLDEITIYHRALTQEKLQAIYEAGSAGKCKNLEIATESLSAILFGEYSSQTLETVFGEPPFIWSIADGTFPSGIDLSEDGIISGTPTEAGEFPFTIRVTDNNNDTAEKIFTIEVLITLPPPDIRIHKTGTVTVPGRIVDYFILVENVGAVKTPDLAIEEHLISPDFRTDVYSFVSAAPEPDFIEDGFILIWVIPSLAPGERQILTYSAQLNASVPLGTPIVGGACYDDDGKINMGAMKERMASTGTQCRQCVDVCYLSYCNMLESCVDDCDDVPWPFKKVCISLCGIVFAECSGCLVGCADNYCADDCSTGSHVCQSCPAGCGCDEQPALGAIDPNKKVSIAKRYIQPDQLLVYAIHYENIGEIEARDVFLTDVLDTNLDDSTIEFITSEGASYNPATRTVRFDLLNRNLQPDETDNVLFSVRPLPGLSSGTEIRNLAVIQFEVFDPCVTNEVVNIIDTDPPSSMMDPLPSETSTSNFLISWSGEDYIGEIDFYTIFVSVDGGGFTPFLQRIADTSARFEGEAGRTYEFICIATDTAGNTEIKDTVAEAITHVIATIPIADAGGPYQGIPGEPILFQAGGSHDPDGEIVLYEWDWDQDDQYDHSTSDPNSEHTWYNFYYGPVGLRVTDNDGLTRTDTAMVYVGPVMANHLVDISGGRLSYDRRTELFQVNVTITNISNDAIGNPLWLGMESIVPNTVTIVGPDGFTICGKPYIDLSDLLGDGILSPGESVEKVIYFDNPSRVRFRAEMAVYGIIAGGSGEGLGGTFAVGNLPRSDINGDGEVNLEDFALFANSWMRNDCRGENDWCNGFDFNQDGKVDKADFDNLKMNWMK